MRVAIVDVGSNTARLLVADVSATGALVAVEEAREHLALGAEIAETGKLSKKTLAVVADVTGSFAKRARKLGVDRGEAIVTAPGRQGRAAGALVASLADATSLPVRILSSDKEGRLAYHGAIARAGTDLPEVVGVVDVGGGSTEVVIGTPLAGAAWVRSIDLGSLRLTHLCLAGDPPRRKELAAARSAAREALAELAPPHPDAAYASGGSARAVGKLVGRTLGESELEVAIATLGGRPSAKVARDSGIHPLRARTVLAGAVLLFETARLLDRPLSLARGGLREGAALALAAVPSAAAA